MSNKLTKQPSPLDTPVTCSLCGQTLYGPTGDMQSQRGMAFGAALHRHVASKHPERVAAIIKMNDLFVSWCAYTLFTGDENFREMLDGYRQTLSSIILGEPLALDAPSEPPQPPGPTPENTVEQPH